MDTAETQFFLAYWAEQSSLGFLWIIVGLAHRSRKGIESLLV